MDEPFHVFAREGHFTYSWNKHLMFWVRGYQPVFLDPVSGDLRRDQIQDALVQGKFRGVIGLKGLLQEFSVPEGVKSVQIGGGEDEGAVCVQRSSLRALEQAGGFIQEGEELALAVIRPYPWNTQEELKLMKGLLGEKDGDLLMLKAASGDGSFLMGRFFDRKMAEDKAFRILLYGPGVAAEALEVLSLEDSINGLRVVPEMPASRVMVKEVAGVISPDFKGLLKKALLGLKSANPGEVLVVEDRFLLE